MAVISPDNYLLNDKGEYEFTEERAGKAWAKAWTELDRALARRGVNELVVLIGIPGSGKTWYLGHSGAAEDHTTVYFDATNCRRPTRLALANIARRNRCRACAVVLDTPIGTCLHRNAKRPPNRRVPEGTIARMYESLMADWRSLERDFEDIRVVCP